MEITPAMLAAKVHLEYRGPDPSLSLEEIEYRLKVYEERNAELTGWDDPRVMESLF